MDAATTTPQLEQPRDGGVLMQRLVRWIRRSTCRHGFRLGDQSLTGIAPPSEPDKNAGFDVWMKYHQSLGDHPSHTKRVQWPCAKCGKVFFAHCGLDVLSHGQIIPPNAEVSHE